MRRHTRRGGERGGLALARAAAAVTTNGWIGRQCYSIESLEPRMLLAVSPIGSEFRVNSSPDTSQQVAAVAADADGDFVVAWQTYDLDGTSRNVFARRYSAAGIPQGDDFRVNTTTADQQAAPAVAMDADGDFVIAWQSGNNFGAGQDGAGYGVYAQRYDAAGNPRGGEFRVNTATAGNEDAPAVAMDAAGNFVVVWQASEPQLR